MRSASPWQRVVVLPVVFLVASLAATFYLKAYDVYRKPFFESGTFRMLTNMEVMAIAPLLDHRHARAWAIRSPAAGCRQLKGYG